MGLLYHLLPHVILLLDAIALCSLVSAQDQAGYINIDCGLPRGTSYIDAITGLTYESDAELVDTGISEEISPEFNTSSVVRQLYFVRSFPQGTRNCYKFGVANNTQYLVRATFMYADYDGRNEVPKFDLHIGPNMWDTVTLDSVTSLVYKELVHLMTMSYIQVCLVYIGSGRPFISALELRPLRDVHYNTEFGSLAGFYRNYFGSASNEMIRYPNDTLDRLWFPLVSSEWSTINTTEVVNNSINYVGLAPPQVVMSTAATPANPDKPLEFSINFDENRLQLYPYLYFAEVEKLHDESRQIYINLDGDYWYGPFSPVYLVTHVIFLPSIPMNGGPRRLSLNKSENSTLPPLINAIEVYSVVKLSQNHTDQIEVDAITNVKFVYGIKRNWQGDPCAPQAYQWDGLSCNYMAYSSPHVTSLDLSSTGLTGEITPYISNLTQLQYLDLSNNSLTGPLPGFLTLLPSLKVLNVAHNQLAGLIPFELTQRSKQNSLVLIVEGNPNLCSSLPCKKKKKSAFIFPVLLSVSIVLLISTILVLGYGFGCLIAETEKAKTSVDGNANLCFSLPCKKKKKKSTFVFPVVLSVSIVLLIVTILVLGYGLAALLLKLKSQQLVKGKTSKFYELLKKKGRFTYSQLTTITNNFERVLGKGGFGTVYHGYLYGDQVAVKMLTTLSAQGYKQFQAEVDVLLRVHHGNLLSLVGFCDDSNQMGLIYEYMVNGNLEDYISDNSRDPLTWKERLRICIGAAQGVDYLHRGCEPQIVHRDVKTANILLNEKLQAKLADFGLSRSFPLGGGSHLFTDIVGTFGYFDPEYFRSRRFTTKSDVYSFGVVLLEIITSKPAVVEKEEMTHISHWVSSTLEIGEVGDVVDPKLGGEFDINSVKKAVEVAMVCVSLNSSERPSMHQVINELTECLELELARNRGAEVESEDPSELVVSSNERSR